MLVDKFTKLQHISIKQPRYHDGSVLVATYKVGDHNVIEFTEAPSLPDRYYVSGKTIREYPIGTNGRIKVYQVPIEEMELYEGRDQ